MIRHNTISDRNLHRSIRRGQILFGGNIQLRIYGLLRCSSGKRMKNANRVFFVSEQEALANGFRPCGHCLRELYKKWKNGFI